MSRNRTLPIKRMPYTAFVVYQNNLKTKWIMFSRTDLYDLDLDDVRSFLDYQIVQTDGSAIGLGAMLKQGGCMVTTTENNYSVIQKP